MIFWKRWLGIKSPSEELYRAYRPLRIVKRPNYKRRLVWLLIVLLLICYALVVSSWWIEGNRQFERSASDTMVQ